MTLDSPTFCTSLTIDNGGQVTDATNNVGLSVSGATSVAGTLTGGTAAFSLASLTVTGTLIPGVQTISCTGTTDFTGATITGGGTTNWTLQFVTNNINFTPLYTDEVTPHFYNVTVATDTKTVTLLEHLCLENQIDMSACATSGGITSDAAEIIAFTNSNSSQANPLVLHANATLPAGINLNMTNAYNIPASANYNILYVKSVNTQTATATGNITCTYLYVGDHNAGQECTFDINTRTVTSTGNCLIGNTGGNTRSGYITISTGELQVDGTFTSDVNSSGIVPSGAATLDFNGTVTINGGTVGANVSWIADWEGNISVAGGTLSLPDNSGSFNFAANLSRTSGTITHNSGTITLDGSVQQDITSGSQLFYHVITSGAGTIYYMKDDTTIFDLDIQTPSTFEIDAVTELVPLTLKFSDIASCGFTTSDGYLLCQGNGSFGVGITSAVTPPTNYWDFDCAITITADYTTFSYFDEGRSWASVDVDNCAFDHGSTNGVYINGTNISSFTNNTLDNNAGSSLKIHTGNYTAFDNIVVTNVGTLDIEADNTRIEFVNSNFDATNCGCGTTGIIFSDAHGDVANTQALIMADSDTVLLSEISGTIGTGDTLTLYPETGAIGTPPIFNIDGAFAILDLNISADTEFDVDGNVTMTIDQGGTVTVNNGGYLDWTGSAGNLITLRSSTPTMAWFLDAKTGSTLSISYVDVQDSDASISDAGELPIDATNNCIDSTRNIQWDFGTTPSSVLVFQNLILGT